MASPAPSQPSATATASNSKPKPSQPPVPILPSQFARVYAVAHPALLLSLVTYRFSSVIDNPVSELLGDIPYLVGLQVVFVMSCLPPAGSEKESPGAGTDDTKKKVPGSAPRRRGKPSGAGSPWSAGLVQVVWKLTVTNFSLLSPISVTYRHS